MIPTSFLPSVIGTPEMRNFAISSSPSQPDHAVRNTVREWDGREMADQIELNIGKDLQAIRVNGTIVGGVIGLGLHLLTYAAGGT